MTTKLKLVDESPLFAKHHNSVWETEINLLKETAKSIDERFPLGLYSLSVRSVFGEEIADLEIQHVEIIGDNHLTLFAWLTTAENCGKVALEVLK
jgi:hypothetical protein